MKNINYEELNKIVNETRNMSCDKLIELHSDLTTKNYVDICGNKRNCGIKLLYALLDFCYGKIAAVEMPKNYTIFLTYA